MEPISIFKKHSLFSLNKKGLKKNIPRLGLAVGVCHWKKGEEKWNRSFIQNLPESLCSPSFSLKRTHIACEVDR